MTRFFFDTNDGTNGVYDDTGFELPSSQEACKLARRCLPEMARDARPDGSNRVYEVRVRDENGNRVYVATLAFQDEYLAS